MSKIKSQRIKEEEKVVVVTDLDKEVKRAEGLAAVAEAEARCSNAKAEIAAANFKKLDFTAKTDQILGNYKSLEELNKRTASLEQRELELNDWNDRISNKERDIAAVEAYDLQRHEEAFAPAVELLVSEQQKLEEEYREFNGIIKEWNSGNHSAKQVQLNDRRADSYKLNDYIEFLKEVGEK